ncbi:LPXTG cell wall anchor domain-containing protein, partial [Weissella minor]
LDNLDEETKDAIKDAIDKGADQSEIDQIVEDAKNQNDQAGKDSGNENPDGKPDEGDSGNENPDGKPDEGDSGNEKPDGKPDEGDSGNEKPDGKPDEGDSGNEKPDGKPDEGDSGNEKPDGKPGEGNSKQQQPKQPSDGNSELEALKHKAKQQIKQLPLSDAQKEAWLRQIDYAQTEGGIEQIVAQATQEALPDTGATSQANLGLIGLALMSLGFGGLYRRKRED